MVTRLPFPYFAAVTCRQSVPDPLREKGRKSEGGKPQVVYPLVRPRGVSAVPFASQAKSPQKKKISKKLRNFEKNT